MERDARSSAEEQGVGRAHQDPAPRRRSVLIVRDGEQGLPEISAVVSAVHKAVAATAFEH